MSLFRAIVFCKLITSLSSDLRQAWLQSNNFIEEYDLNKKDEFSLVLYILSAVEPISILVTN